MMALQPGETHTKKAHQDKTAALGACGTAAATL